MNQTSKFFRKDIDDSWTWQSEDVKIFLKLDAKNKIYKYHFFTSVPELFKQLDWIGIHILDKHIENLLNSCASTLQNKLPEAIGLSWERVFYSLNKAFMAIVGDLSISTINADRIICRCAHLDEEALEQLFLKFNGDVKEIKRSSNMGLTCAECEPLTKKLLQRLSYSNDGLLVYFRLKFPEYSPLSVCVDDFKSVKLDEDTICIEISNSYDEINEKLILSLENFFSSKLNRAIMVKLTTF